MSLLSVSGVSKRGEGAPVIDNISFTQSQFQKMAIAGETGSGKSTLLKIIAGLVQPDKGEVLFEGVRVKGPEEKLLPGHPGIAYLSQQFELRNNYRVEEELDYTNQLPEDEALFVYDICRIKHLMKRRTDQVSGGERQRIALARLLTSAPRLLLLDEPFSNLDMIHKNLLKSVIRDIGEQLKITCMLISHDPTDTLSWADEILVLKAGEILQKGTPEQIYHQPVNEYVAGLFGTYNLIPTSLFKNFFPFTGVNPPGKKIFARPEYFEVSTDEADGLWGKVMGINFLGTSYEIDVQLQDYKIMVRTENGHIKRGDIVCVFLSSDRLWYL